MYILWEAAYLDSRHTIFHHNADIILNVNSMGPEIIVYLFCSFRNSQFDHEQSVVKYDGTLVNVGNGMNVTSGIFTAPHPGIYAFNFHALTRDGTATYIKIMHNGRNVGGAYRRHEGEGDESHDSVVRFIILNEVEPFL